MNREILFRGKRVDNGEWVEGYYCLGPYSGEPVIMRDDGSCKKIDPSTRGEYTGLTDRNGKRIFEGDIVQYPIEQGKHRDTNLHRVVFERRGGSAYFGIVMDKDETWQFCLSVPAKLMEIVGNIHDNPELVGGNDHGSA